MIYQVLFTCIIQYHPHTGSVKSEQNLTLKWLTINPVTDQQQTWSISEMQPPTRGQGLRSAFYE